jgi:hypothetical protein
MASKAPAGAFGGTGALGAAGATAAMTAAMSEVESLPDVVGASADEAAPARAPVLASAVSPAFR